MLFVLFTRRLCPSVTVTNYINQHKKSTGFRDVQVVFLNIKVALALSGLTCRIFLQKNRLNNHMILQKK